VGPIDEKNQLKGKSIVVYDLEIKLPIDGKTVTWSSFGSMGISVGVSFDYRDGDIRTYFDDNMHELVAQLNGAEMVVGFNQIGFDNKLLRAQVPNLNSLKSDEELLNYDILVESRKSLGYRPGDPFPKGCKLDNHLEAMFGKAAMKTGHGELAPQLYQKKQWGPLVSYCIADVKRTCMVFENIWHEGWVQTLVHGQKWVTAPQSLLGVKNV
jgi:hypothetical protein